jgi:enoyl-CoA hydratase/carnithine racemase
MVAHAPSVTKHGEARTSRVRRAVRLPGMPAPAYVPLAVAVADGVATITIEHPPINLIDAVLYPALIAAVDAVAKDDAARVVVLRSVVPGFFLAHFDVTLIQRLPVDAAPARDLNSFHRLAERLRTMSKPTIAVIAGRCGGGGSELALSCDMRFAAAETAVFNQPEVALGILPGGSGTVRLGRLVGRSRTMEIILGCDDVDAATAERYGWINRAMPAAELIPFVDRLAARIASFPPHAVAAAKAAVLRAEHHVADGLLHEAADFSATLGHADTQAALARFLAVGGQSVDGESRLGDTLAKMGE